MKRGRPRAAPAERRSRHLTVWLTAEQAALIRRAADADGMSPSAWARRVLFRAAAGTGQ